MENKNTNPIFLVLLVMFTVSCNTAVSPTNENVTQGNGEASSVYAVVDTSLSDDLLKAKVIDVPFDVSLKSTVFNCVLLGVGMDSLKIIRVRPSNCYSTLKVVNPNDTIEIWAHLCTVCEEKMSYFYPPCEVKE